MNKFILSGIVQSVDSKLNLIAFSVPTPNTGNMLANMKFDPKVVKQVEAVFDKTNVLITVEGFHIPSQNNNLDLVITNVLVTNIPNKVVNQA